MNWRYRREYESDLRSNEHCLSSSENKARKKFRPVRDLNMTCAIPVEHLHRYRTGHEFKSLTGMTFSQALFLLLLRKFFYVKGKRPGSREDDSMPAEQPV